MLSASEVKFGVSRNFEQEPFSDWPRIALIFCNPHLDALFNSEKGDCSCRNVANLTAITVPHQMSSYLCHIPRESA
jgi:hypothetical protein